MNKKVIVVLLFLISLLTFGCQSTPKEEIVLQKNTDTMLQKAISSNTSVKVNDMIRLPNNQYIEKQIVSNNERITIRIDANIVIPEVDTIPIMKIVRGSFDRETIKAVHGALCQGKEEIISFPKSTFQKDLESLLLLKESGNLDKFASKEELDDAISEMQTKISNAPNTAITKEPSFEQEKRMKSYYFISDEQQQTVSKLFIDKECRIEYIRDVHNQDFLSNYIIDRNPISSLIPRINRHELRLITPNCDEVQAKQIASKCISDIGLLDFSCVGCRVAPLFSEVNDISNNELSCVYELLFTRCIHSVPVLFTNTIMSNEIGNSQSYAAPWYYERIRVFVDDKSIWGLIWEGPYQIEETVVNSTPLLAFDDVLHSFEKTVGYKYAASEGMYLRDNATISISRIELGLVRVIEKNDINVAYLVPAWVFYGVVNVDDRLAPDGIGYDGYESVLIVNAIDGSIIDMEKGY